MLGTSFLAAFSVLAIFVIVYYFALINVDASAYFAYLLETNARLANKALAGLLNANSLVNLPHVNLTTAPLAAGAAAAAAPGSDGGAHRCHHGAVRLGDLHSASGGTDYGAACRDACGAAGRVIELHAGDEWYDNGRRLTPGAWCVTNTAECNLRTGYVVAGASGVVCKTKYPNMFGGESAGTVVACQNQVYRANGSVLYDRLRGEPVDPLTVDMTDEDEPLPGDGGYRFVCKFADDVHGNRYVANPLNRFHPMQDHCTKTLRRAARSVGLKEDRDGWFCDCGEFADTRVKHADPRDRKSTCTSCYAEMEGDVASSGGGGATVKAPYTCFTRNSKFSMAASEFPCAGRRFNEGDGDMCGQVTLNVMRITDGTEDTVMGMHSMPYSGAGFYGEHNVLRRVLKM